MALQLNLTSLVLFLFLLFSILAHVESSLARPKTQTRTYIESSCKGTLYPDLCIRCLSRCANSNIDGPHHLAHVALSVSLSRALETRGYLLKVAKELKAMKINKREYLIVQDCGNQISDSVEQLNLASKELRRLKQLRSSSINDKVLWHISNIETWGSTALTDAAVVWNHSLVVYYFLSPVFSKFSRNPVFWEHVSPFYGEHVCTECGPFFSHVSASFSATH